MYKIVLSEDAHVYITAVYRRILFFWVRFAWSEYRRGYYYPGIDAPQIRDWQRLYNIPDERVINKIK